MQYEILVTKTALNGYSARPVALPELIISGDNEVDDPWLRYAGIWKDMPEQEWQEYLSAIAEFRQAIELHQ